MSSARPTIAVVCPCYNEEKVIEIFYHELKRVLDTDCAEFDHQILLVDDGSSDDTLTALKRLEAADTKVRVYSLSRNFGHQIALSAGLDHADADVVVFLDSDLQHPPEVIPELIDRWREGHDVVQAVRQRTEGAGLLKRFTSSAFYRCFNWISDVQITAGAADFALLSRRAHEALLQLPERNRFLRGLVAWIGFPTAQVPYEAAPRAAGESKYDVKRMVALAINAGTSFTARPMRVAAKLGGLFLAGGLVYMAYIIARWLTIGDLVPGWASILVSILLASGLNLMFLGLIGEYVARVFDEVKGRPLYLLKYRPQAEAEQETYYDPVLYRRKGA